MFTLAETLECKLFKFATEDISLVRSSISKACEIINNDLPRGTPSVH